MTPEDRVNKYLLILLKKRDFVLYHQLGSPIMPNRVKVHSFRQKDPLLFDVLLKELAKE